MKEMVKTYQATELRNLQTETTSKGNQQKWYDPRNKVYVKGQFFYQGRFWRDDLVENIASHIGERFLSFRRILQINQLEYPEKSEIKDKWQFVLETVSKYADLDFTDYMIVMVIIDYLVGNEDRHLNNFGILANDHFRPAPLFDFGLGLFEHDLRYLGEPLRKSIEMMEGKPFSSNLEKVVDFLSEKYDLSDYLPAVLDLTECELPSLKAGSYLLKSAHHLGMDVTGI